VLALLGRCIKSTLFRTAQGIVFTTSRSNLLAVRDSNGKLVQFGSRRVHQPNPQLHGGPIKYSYLSTRWFSWVWLQLSVPISGSCLQVFLFMVALRYPNVMCIISTLVHHCLFLFYWLPLYSKQAETCSLLHPEVDSEQFFVLHQEYD